ncbi:unnamed protein product [Trichobilharzia szidati]|nr:unnamed protein product [Trichobilharzia szidati]
MNYTIVTVLITLTLLQLHQKCIYGDGDCPGNPKVLFLSIDGFPYDYFDLAEQNNINLSAFKKIQHSGVYINRLTNVFPSSTFPSHYTMATGLYPESHGIVDNVFYDPIINTTFSIGNPKSSNDSRFFDVGAEPIWVTNQLQGYKTGIVYWIGSEAEVKGVRPNFYLKPYNDSITFKQRIDLLMSWYENKGINLGLLYYHQPDKVGHIHGAGSHQVLEAIEYINNQLEYLLMSIESRPNLKCSLNLVVSSDHGMANISADRIIYLNDYVESSEYISAHKRFSVVWTLWPKSGSSAESLYRKLKGKHQYMKVYLKNKLPKRLQYEKSWRIGPVVVFADLGWTIVAERNSQNVLKYKGGHGYDPIHEQMSSFLMAMGPRVRNNYTDLSDGDIHLVDIYDMLCLLLDLEPAPNNGSIHRILPFLTLQRNGSNPKGIQITAYIAAIILSIFVSHTALIPLSSM